MQEKINVIKTIGVLIIKNDKVLLVKHGKSAEHLNDKYGLPAGRIILGESEKETAKRELKEETGLDVDLDNLVLLPKEWTAKIERKEEIKEFSLKVFYTNKFSGSLINSDETSPEWVFIDDLRDVDLLPNVLGIINSCIK
ncbi:MAG: NUDIX hydrolase [Patescibacteria group bacterium]|jgi:ADP-ribose pyrophosphatase YjhB (NUDIX family)